MRREPVETFEHAGKKIVIEYDEDPENPRESQDWLAVLACTHSRYNLGDKSAAKLVDDAPSKDELVDRIEAEGDKVLAILPLYLYDHSGISMSVGAFSCMFDSGQVGWAFVTEGSAKRMGCVGPRRKYNAETERCEPAGEWDEAAFEEAIKAEVNTYDAYLRGEAYGYRVLSALDGEELDSCWGYVGDLDYVRACAKESAEGATDPAVAAQAAELASRATYAGVPA